jgi:hypothetical protein
VCVWEQGDNEKKIERDCFNFGERRSLKSFGYKRIKDAELDTGIPI